MAYHTYFVIAKAYFCIKQAALMEKLYFNKFYFLCTASSGESGIN